MTQLSPRNEHAIYESADILRIRLADALGIAKPHHLIFTNGVTTSLRLALAGLGLKTLLLGPDEYLTPKHLFPLRVATSGKRALFAAVAESDVEVVILSVVSWRGRPFDVARLFSELRRECAKRCPLLIADYSHAGAAGFPPIPGLDADVVVGDLQKWVLPNGVANELCFLYSGSRRLNGLFQRIFATFFLATQSRGERQVRWIDPAQITHAAGWASRVDLSRTLLAKRHQANVELKLRLLSCLDCTDTGSLIVWQKRGTRVPPWLKPDLVWRTGSGARLLCRADIQDSH